MKIINKTHWRTDHIRAFISRIAKDELDGHWAAKMKALRVSIVYTRPGGGVNTSYSSGCAVVGGTWMCIRLATVNPDLIDFAHVIAHEMAHLRGMHHNMMRDDPRYSRVDNWRDRYSWAAEMTLEKKIVVKRDAIEQRRERVAELLANWERRLKTATKKVRTYRSKVKYYEKREELKMAAALPQ